MTTLAPHAFGKQASVEWAPSAPASTPLPYPGLVAEYESHASAWLEAASDVEAHAFDSMFPGIGGLAPLAGPAVALDLGTLVLGIETTDAIPSIADGSSLAAVSDAVLMGFGTRWRFSSPIHGLHVFYGSFAPGCAVTMKLYSGETHLKTLQREAGSDPVAALGHGFLSEAPVDRIDFSIDCSDTILLGAFLGLAPGETSLGTTFIPGYAGPMGSDVEFDFAFTRAPPSLDSEQVPIQMISLPWSGQAELCSGCSTENCESKFPSVSADGRFVAFMSGSEQLSPDDGNCWRDVFVRDRDPDGNGILDDTVGVTTLVSVDGQGVPGHGASGAGTTSISNDGAHVAFASNASSLVPDDTNQVTDVFVHSSTGGLQTTVRVSLGPQDEQAFSGSGGPSISADGRHVLFNSGASNFAPGLVPLNDNIYVRDRDPDGNLIFDEQGNRTTILLTLGVDGEPGNAPSRGASLSADGR